MLKKKEKLRARLSWTSVIMFEIEVIKGSIIVGKGLNYWDGKQLLKPDIASLTGEVLPEDWYTLMQVSGPKLVILARTIQ